MTITATIPAQYAEQANGDLEALGFGPDNFSVPLAGETETHVGFHAWDNSPFLAAVQSLDYPGLEITVGTTIDTEDGPVQVQNQSPNFSEHIATHALEWHRDSQTNWHENPIMRGDRRTVGETLWESLLDYNVWEPPIGWREIVEQGYPAWVQPTGAHDAYAAGEVVTHNGQTWDNAHGNGNVWEPGVYGWTARA
jgi:hypothetical protein